MIGETSTGVGTGTVITGGGGGASGMMGVTMTGVTVGGAICAYAIVGRSKPRA